MWHRLRDFQRALRRGAAAAERIQELVARMAQEQGLAALAATPRFNEPGRLLASGYKVYSQGHEDGMIAEIFRRIGTSSRRFVEIGVENGLECNTTYLLLQGWSGAWIEASAENCASARRTFAGYPLEIVERFATPETADGLIAGLSGEGGIDLLSIDIDSHDYWVWKAVTSVAPRVVVVEYNATLPPEVSKTIPYDPAYRWDGSNYFGASLGALAELAAAKGYCLVGCSPAGVNAFFVRRDLVGEHFLAPFSAANHYEPPRYHLAGPSGHRPGFGRWSDG